MPKSQFSKRKSTESIDLKWSGWPKLTLFLALLMLAQSIAGISWNKSDYFKDGGINVELTIASVSYIFNALVLIAAVIVFKSIFNSKIILDSHWAVRMVHKLVPAMTFFRAAHWLYIFVSILMSRTDALGLASILLNMAVWLAYIYFIRLVYLSMTDFAVERSYQNYQLMQDVLQWTTALSIAQAITNFVPLAEVWRSSGNSTLLLHISDLLRVLMMASLWKALHHLPRKQR